MRLIPAKDLLQGDLIDIEGDKYAEEEWPQEFAYERVEVEDVVLETRHRVVVYTDGCNFACPPGHLVSLVQRGGEPA